MFKFRVNPLFLLLVVLFILVGMTEEVLVSFTLVLVHELTHVLVSWKLGYHITKVELFPFGGMAEYSGLLEMEPGHEIVIALSGPAVNLILAGFFLLLDLELFIKYNLIIACFNLLPALPLDGGRVLRGIMVSRYGFRQGTDIAIKISKILAVLGFLTGVMVVCLQRSNLWILFISFFVYGAALQEKKQVIYSLYNYLTRRHEYVRELQIKKIYSQVVREDLLIKSVIYVIIPDKFNIFYVLNQDSRITGMITEVELLDSFFATRDQVMKVGEIVINNHI